MRSKFLIVTEKHEASAHLRDGGARVISSLLNILGEDADIIQFGDTDGRVELRRMAYPFEHTNRFRRRLLNADWIASQVSAAANGCTDVIFVHTSMLFGMTGEMLAGKKIWLMPMFLGTSYRLAGEDPPAEYLEAEKRCLRLAHRIITPSHFEKTQLVTHYEVDANKIKVIPRGVKQIPGIGTARKLSGRLNFCSVGSIKPQKNTLSVIRRFATISERHPGSHLLLVGPIQDAGYFKEVLEESSKLNLGDSVSYTGYVTPEEICGALADCHIHLSDTRCETFGRTIFETLAIGIPNLLPGHRACAAAEHLQDKPYCRFYDDEASLLEGLSCLLDGYEQRSKAALEIGFIFDGERLDGLLHAELRNLPQLLITDFDGTLFHKHDPELTRMAIESAQAFPALAICSARNTEDLKKLLSGLSLKANWLIGASGAEIECVRKGMLHRECFTPEELELISSVSPEARIIKSGDQPIQALTHPMTAPAGLRAETYAEGTYLCPQMASKLIGALRLIDMIGWKGRVSAWGDGPSDLPSLMFFDGVRFPRNMVAPHLSP